MAAIFLLLALLGHFAFSNNFLDAGFRPDAYWLIPGFFLLLTLVLAVTVGNKEKQKKELSVNLILGIRMMFITLILIFVVIVMLANRDQAIPVAANAAIYSVIFLYFETRVLLEQNKRHRKIDQEKNNS